MEWIIDNWYIVIGLVAAFVAVGIAVFSFFRMSDDKQKAKVKEWLIWACIEAEKALQSGTGKLKLREVWNKFVSIPAFSFIAKMITFEEFEVWVKEALIIVKNMLISNASLATYVYGNNASQEIEKIKQQLEQEQSETE